MMHFITHKNMIWRGQVCELLSAHTRACVCLSVDYYRPIVPFCFKRTSLTPRESYDDASVSEATLNNHTTVSYQSTRNWLHTHYKIKHNQTICIWYVCRHASDVNCVTGSRSHRTWVNFKWDFRNWRMSVSGYLVNVERYQPNVFRGSHINYKMFVDIWTIMSWHICIYMISHHAFSLRLYSCNELSY